MLLRLILPVALSFIASGCGPKIKTCENDLNTERVISLDALLRSREYITDGRFKVRTADPSGRGTLIEKLQELEVDGNPPRSGAVYSVRHLDGVRFFVVDKPACRFDISWEINPHSR